jgi:hypothetical protein
MGALFGSLAELMPEAQTTLAGILRLWAGLFVACGFGLMVVGGVLGGGLTVSRVGARAARGRRRACIMCRVAHETSRGAG